MAPTPSSHPATASNTSQESTQRQGIFQRRPRFLRAITSPIPTSRDPNTSQPQTIDTATSAQNASTLDPMDSSNTIPTANTAATLVSSVASFQEVSQSPRAIRPGLHPIHKDHSSGADAQMRSFSTSSVHQASSFLPAASGAAALPPAQSRHPVTETLKEHRWSKGLKLNWMPGLGSNSGQQNTGLESR